MRTRLCLAAEADSGKENNPLRGFGIICYSIRVFGLVEVNFSYYELKINRIKNPPTFLSSLGSLVKDKALYFTSLRARGRCILFRNFAALIRIHSLAYIYWHPNVRLLSYLNLSITIIRNSDSIMPANLRAQSTEIILLIHPPNSPSIPCILAFRCLIVDIIQKLPIYFRNVL
jgi:hypothetical protein